MWMERRIGKTNQVVLSGYFPVSLGQHGTAVRQDEHGQVDCQPIFSFVGLNKLVQLAGDSPGQWSQDSCVHDTLHLCHHDNRHWDDPVEWAIGIVHHLAAKFVVPVHTVWIASFATTHPQPEATLQQSALFHGNLNTDRSGNRMS